MPQLDVRPAEPEPRAATAQPEPSEEPSADRAAEQPPVTAQSRERHPRALFQPPPKAQSQPAARAAVVVPPPPSVPVNNLPEPSLPLHLPSSAPAPAAPVYSGPRSGRLIWTGSLGRRGVVEIDGAKASVGTLLGTLPGVPVNLTISPAQFGEKGLVIYTNDAGRNLRREPAGSSNGWNATTFEWDPERVRQIAVLEAPHSTNSFERLVLRNDARNCAVIVIEWSVR
jgi:hypothetical protein